MNRIQLGERLCQWHSSMEDPIYAVGSFYFANQIYPDKQIVLKAISNLEQDLFQQKQMLVGQIVTIWNKFHHKMVDLRSFAGYTNKDLKNNIEDLTTIVLELKKIFTQDYGQEAVSNCWGCNQPRVPGSDYCAYHKAYMEE